MEEYFERNLMKELKKWIGKDEIFAIKGPRQSGKTTMLTILEDWLLNENKVDRKNIIMLTFEDLEIREKFTTDPKSFIDSYIQNDHKYYFLMDEYHYVKDGGQKLKLLYDTMKNVKFIITGSSSLEIADISKYLVGRVFIFYLFPLNFDEFLVAKNKRLSRIWKEKNNLVKEFLLENKDFAINQDIFAKDISKHLEEFVTFGGYPRVVKTHDIEEKRLVLKNIYETYITRDVEGLLRIIYDFKFRKILTMLSSQIGGMINYNELATSCNSYYKEILELLNVLENTYIIKLLRPFHKSLRTEMVKNPKVYFIDIGMRNFILNNFSLIDARTDKGAVMENHAFNSIFYIMNDFWKINYWRTVGKAEVDFIIEVGEEHIPVELKFQPFKKPEISRSLRSYISAYNPRRVIVCTKDFWGEMQLNSTKIKFIPLCYF